MEPNAPVRVADLARELGLKPAALRRLGRALGLWPRAERSVRQEYEAVHAKMLFLVVSLARLGESLAFAAFLLPELRLAAERMARDPGVRLILVPDDPLLDVEGNASPDLLDGRHLVIFLGAHRVEFHRAIREGRLAIR